MGYLPDEYLDQYCKKRVYPGDTFRWWNDGGWYGPHEFFLFEQGSLKKISIIEFFAWVGPEWEERDIGTIEEDLVEYHQQIIIDAKKNQTHPKMYLERGETIVSYKNPTQLLFFSQVRAWAKSQKGTEEVGIAHSIDLNPFARYLDRQDPYRVHKISQDIVITKTLGGFEESSVPPVWVCEILAAIYQQKGHHEPITGSQFLSFLDEYDGPIERDVPQLHNCTFPL